MCHACKHFRAQSSPTPFYLSLSLSLSLVGSLFCVLQVLWWVVPTQLASWVAMVVVVAFSSCLDVAAIEMEVAKPLNYNHELKTVGLSNLLSGCLGGYTGSYIFSQTIFNLRARVASRVTGLVIVALEGLVFALPFSPMAYVPRALFGGLLLLIATV